jgi:hypothetical protein
MTLPSRTTSTAEYYDEACSKKKKRTGNICSKVGIFYVESEVGVLRRYVSLGANSLCADSSAYRGHQDKLDASLPCSTHRRSLEFKLSSVDQTTFPH